MTLTKLASCEEGTQKLCSAHSEAKAFCRQPEAANIKREMDTWMHAQKYCTSWAVGLNTKTSVKARRLEFHKTEVTAIWCLKWGKFFWCNLIQFCERRSRQVKQRVHMAEPGDHLQYLHPLDHGKQVRGLGERGDTDPKGNRVLIICIAVLVSLPCRLCCEKDGCACYRHETFYGISLMNFILTLLFQHFPLPTCHYLTETPLSARLALKIDCPRFKTNTNNYYVKMAIRLPWRFSSLLKPTAHITVFQSN